MDQMKYYAATKLSPLVVAVSYQLGGFERLQAIANDVASIGVDEMDCIKGFTYFNKNCVEIPYL